VGQFGAVLFVCRTSCLKITRLQKVMRSCAVIRRRKSLRNLTNPSPHHHSYRHLVFVACWVLYFSNYLALKAITKKTAVWMLQRYSGMVQRQLTLRSVPNHSFSHWESLYFRNVCQSLLCSSCFQVIFTSPLLFSEMVSGSQIFFRLFIVILRHHLLEM